MRFEWLFCARSARRHNGLVGGAGVLLMLVAGACGGGGGGGDSVSAPSAPVLSVGIGVKQLQFTWTNVADADFYRLLESPDGVSTFNRVGGAIAAATTSLTLDIAVHRLGALADASYRLEACNSGGCTASNVVTMLGGALQAIGYIKASNTEAGDFFGRVAVSGDGNTLAVGAIFEASKATGVGGSESDNSASGAGAVYVYARSSGGVWSQQAYVKASNTEANDAFGGALALSDDGNTLAVGASGEDSNARGVGGSENDNSASFAGAVYVYTRSSGGVWSQQAYVKASNTEANDAFGGALALSGDGNTLAVGASGEDSNARGVGGSENDNLASFAGAVYVYARSGGGVWSQQAYVKASNTEANDAFGGALALSSDGITLAVGASGEASNATGVGGSESDNSASGAGAVYVYTRNSGGLWSQQAYVKASNTEANDAFGGALGLSGDGNTLAVGAIGEDSAATGVRGSGQGDNSANAAGAVYVYTRSGGGVWSPQAYIKASNTQANDVFGGSVALSGDGRTLAVGAGGEDGNATGVGGAQGDNSASAAGAVYVYAGNSAGEWPQQAYVKAPNAEVNDFFGRSGALSSDGNTLAVGANFEAGNATGVGGSQSDNSAGAAGAVYLY